MAIITSRRGHSLVCSSAVQAWQISNLQVSSAASWLKGEPRGNYFVLRAAAVTDAKYGFAFAMALHSMDHEA